jgi:hypothetical protein
MDGVILNPPERERDTLATAKRITVDGLDAVEVELDQLLDSNDSAPAGKTDEFDIPEFLK